MNQDWDQYHDAFDAELYVEASDGWFELRARGLLHLPGAAVEGDTEDWRGVLTAIDRRAAFAARRCAIRMGPDGSAAIWSPKNARFNLRFSAESIAALAEDLRRKVGAKHHGLKTWPEHFEAVMAGKKRAEVRLNDRGFEVHDRVRLREFDPVSKEYTGRELDAVITHVLADFVGLAPGWAVLSIEVLR